MDDQIILHHDKQSLAKLPDRPPEASILPQDLAILNRYLTLIKRRKSPAQAEEITALEFGISDIALSRILQAPAPAKYVADTMERFTPTKEIVRQAVVTGLLDILTFNMADCFQKGSSVPKPLDQMPLDAQSAIKRFGTDRWGNTCVEFYSKIEAAKALVAMDQRGALHLADSSDDSKPKKTGMFDHLKRADVEEDLDE